MSNTYTETMFNLVIFFFIVGSCFGQVQDKKFNHAYVLQDLETYDPAGHQYYNQEKPVNQPILENNIYNYNNPYNSNPYLNFHPTPMPQIIQNPSPQYTNVPQIQTTPQYITNAVTPVPVANVPIPQTQPIVPQVQQPVHEEAPPAATSIQSITQTFMSTTQLPPQPPLSTLQNGYGPHIYSAPNTQYSGPIQTWTDIQNNPVLIIVKSSTDLSYDLAYASNGLSNLDRDNNSKLISKLLLNSSDKVGVVYPTNSFPIKQFSDFTIRKLILPQDLSLNNIFNFYPRYIPILYLYNLQEYYKVYRENTLVHLGQYKYDNK